MDIRVLEYFLAVAREENISRAAKQLHITQPTLSRQLAQLEEELGVTLFTRSSHNIVLTRDGILLKQRAQEIVGLAEKTKNEFVRGEEELSGTISFGCGEFVGFDEIVKLMKDFHLEHPLVTFRIFSGNSVDIKDRIDAGLLDIGAILSYVELSRYECMRIDCPEERHVLVAKDSPLARKKSLTPQDLVDQPLILSERSMHDQSFFHWIGKSADELNVVAVYNLMYNAARMAAAGLGVVDGIDLKCQYEGTVSIPLRPSEKEYAYLVWKRASLQSPAVGAFIDYVKKYKK